jgi:hypothetical protein
MKKLLIVAVSVILLQSCKDSAKDPTAKKTGKKEITTGNKTEIEEGSDEFLIDAPEGWEKSDTMYMGARVVFIRYPRQGPDDPFMENVNIITEEVDADMDEYLERNIENMGQMLTNFKKGEVSSPTVNGIDYKKMYFRHEYAGYPIDGMVYLAKKGKTFYIITCSAGAGKMHEWEEKFNDIVGTFRWKP